MCVREDTDIRQKYFMQNTVFKYIINLYSALSWLKLNYLVVCLVAFCLLQNFSIERCIEYAKNKVATRNFIALTLYIIH